MSNGVLNVLVNFWTHIFLYSFLQVVSVSGVVYCTVVFEDSLWIALRKGGLKMNNHKPTFVIMI